jgi:hypothetical protein
MFDDLDVTFIEYPDGAWILEFAIVMAHRTFFYLGMIYSQIRFPHHFPMRMAWKVILFVHVSFQSSVGEPCERRTK